MNFKKLFAIEKVNTKWIIFYILKVKKNDIIVNNVYNSILVLKNW